MQCLRLYFKEIKIKSSKITKLAIILEILFSITPLFAAPKTETPEWMTSVRKAYPDDEYLAQRGSGKKAELAKNDALANLSRYFQTTVESNLSTSFSSVEEGKIALEKTEVLSTVNLSSSMELFGVEYSEVYYSKKEKLYFCVAYVDRNYAWKIYEPSILKEKKSFYEFYNEALSQAEKEPLLAAKYFVKAKEQGDVFLASLDYGRLINEAKEKSFAPDRDEVASIVKKQKDAKENSILFLNVKGDSAGIVSAKLEKELSDAEFVISKQKNKSLYIVDVVVNSNMIVEDAGTETETFVSTPDININISNINSERAIYSYAAKVSKKSIAYSKENVMKKSLGLLDDEIGEGFIKGLNAVINGE